MLQYLFSICRSKWLGVLNFWVNSWRHFRRIVSPNTKIATRRGKIKRMEVEWDNRRNSEKVLWCPLVSVVLLLKNVPNIEPPYTRQLVDAEKQFFSNSIYARSWNSSLDQQIKINVINRKMDLSEKWRFSQTELRTKKLDMFTYKFIYSAKLLDELKRILESSLWNANFPISSSCF